MPYQHKAGLPLQFAATVGNLSCPTKLEFRYLKEAHADSLRLLPTSLCELMVEMLPGQGGELGQQQPMPLGFLTKLEVLTLPWGGQQASTAHVDLPATLTNMCLGGRVQTAAVPASICYMVLINPAFDYV